MAFYVKNQDVNKPICKKIPLSNDLVKDYVIATKVDIGPK